MRIDIDLPLKAEIQHHIDINLRCLYLEGGHLRLSYLNLPLADIYLRNKYLFVLLNLVTLANIQLLQYTQQ
jgi:hypothetical protein